MPALQAEYLNLADMNAVWTVLWGMDTDYVVMFNCGEAAGASRNHKHLQLMPCPPAGGPFQMFPDTEDSENKEWPFLGLPDEGLPHNLIFVKQWMLLIPRSKAKVGGAGTGSSGVIGMIWVNDEDELNEWKSQGFLEVLKELCFARSKSTK